MDMETILAKLEKINSKSPNYWSRRITSQLAYAVNLSGCLEGRHDGIIGKTVDFLWDGMEREGSITRGMVQQAEGLLSEVVPDAKSFSVICAAHAHIDMNWMWRWDETVAVTLDTFRTMLDLMDEYPDFTFSQSQASVYRIVEEYNPGMLDEIKRRIKEGRWEVTASTWVETDKNMPSGESLARHILYTRRTLSRMLDIDPGSLNIDFEPDTFGHSQNVPEILVRGGIRYYYHCRGYESHNLYLWKAPSRSSVIVYREPLWYNAAIDPSLALYVPEFCTRHGMNTMLKVYGVGDHGGGPTRRDIERILDMAQWPVFPQIRFGTFGEYFRLAEACTDRLPVVNGELNFVFTGCYTSQSRIKAGNSILEGKLFEAEAFASAAALLGGFSYRGDRFAGAWEKVLFNQFHDILPGSGTVDTREYAMGLYQEASAAANTEESLALRHIASRINTEDLASDEDIGETASEGAGAGFGIENFQLPQAERGRGLTRIFHLFNPSLNQRRENVELTIWDWEGNIDRMAFYDANGTVIPHQVLNGNSTHYWGHQYIKVLVKADVPALGYTTVVLKERMPSRIPLPLPLDPRVEHIDSYTLENKYLKAVFDPKTAEITSLIDKGTGQDLVRPGSKTGIFRFIMEDESRGMTAWVVGRHMQVDSIHGRVKYLWLNNASGLLRQSLCYEAGFGGSRLKVVVSLDDMASALRFDVECDFREFGGGGKGIPQLNFHMPVGYECRAYKYDVPSGTIEREGYDMDVPAYSWALAVPKDPGRKPLTIVAPGKHGFRGCSDSLSLTLIRGSFDPDPYPEIGYHAFSFSVGLPNITSNRELIEAAYAFCHPIRAISARPSGGELLKSGSFMRLEEGSIAVQAVKMPEGGGGSRLIIRAYETEGRRTKAVFRFSRSIKKAVFADINENPIKTDLSLLAVGDALQVSVEPFNLVTLLIDFQ